MRIIDETIKHCIPPSGNITEGRAIYERRYAMFDWYFNNKKCRGLVFHIAFCVLSCALLFAACGPKKDTIPVADGLVTAPHQRLTEASLYFYENGVKRWRLDTDYMERPLADTGDILVVPVRISVFDTVGDLSARIISDSGTSDSKMDIFDLWGGVYIRNEEGMTVKSEHLKWLKGARRVTSDTFVQIETPKGDILRGKGLDAMDDFSRFSFSAEVSGKFPDFRRRMEEQDEDFFR